VLDFSRRIRMHDMPEIPITLPIQPERCACTEKTLQPEGRIGGDPTLSVDYLVQSRIRDAKAPCNLGLRNAIWLYEIMKQDFSRMCGRSIRR